MSQLNKNDVAKRITNLWTEQQRKVDALIAQKALQVQNDPLEYSVEPIPSFLPLPDVATVADAEKSTSSAFMEYNANTPPLKLPRPIGGATELPLTELVRGMFISGSTGSGKTSNVLLPIAFAASLYREEHGLYPAIIATDKKGEIEPALRRYLANRPDRKIIALGGQSNSRINAFEHTRRLPNETRAQWTERMTRFIFEELGYPLEGDQNSHFADNARDVVTELFKMEAALQDRYQKQGLEMGCFVTSFSEALKTLIIKAQRNESDTLPTIEQLRIELKNTIRARSQSAPNMWQAIHALLIHLRQNVELIPIFKRLCQNQMNSVGVTEMINPMSCFGGSDDERQVGYLLQSINRDFTRINSAELRSVFMLDPLQESCKDIWSMDETICLNLTGAIDSGTIIVLRGLREYSHNERLIGLFMKSLLVKSIERRPTRERPVFLIFDECHNFYSTAGNTAESVLASWGRAFRTALILGTQSLSAIKATVSREGLTDPHIEIDSLNANMTTKIFCNQDDRAASEYLDRISGTQTYQLTSEHGENAPPQLSQLPVGAYYMKDVSGKLSYHAPLPMEPIEAAPAAKNHDLETNLTDRLNEVAPAFKIEWKQNTLFDTVSTSVEVDDPEAGAGFSHNLIACEKSLINLIESTQNLPEQSPHRQNLLNVAHQLLKGNPYRKYKSICPTLLQRLDQIGAKFGYSKLDNTELRTLMNSWYRLPDSDKAVAHRAVCLTSKDLAKLGGFTRSLAAGSGLDGGALDMARIQGGFVLSGTHRSWMTGQQGEIADFVLGINSVNPIVILENLDMLPRSLQYPAMSTLIEMINPEINMQFKDEFLQIPLNLSQFYWIATASGQDAVPKELQSLFWFIDLDSALKPSEIDLKNEPPF